MVEISAAIMLEILGKPAKHIKKILNEIIGKLEKENDVSITEKKIAEPKKVAGEESLFTSFAEIEFQTTVGKLMAICFGYMPSHVEIIYPEELKIKNNDFNMLLNELLRRLHQYDELAKAMMIERKILAKQIQDGNIKIVRESESSEKINNESKLKPTKKNSEKKDN